MFVEVFNLLTTVRTEYVEKFSRNMLTPKDKESLGVIDQINREMQDTMQIHKRLLNEAVEITAEKEKIRLRRLGAAFSIKFNFDAELDRIVQQKLNPESLKAIIHPLLNPTPHKMFNPLKAFAPQRIIYDRQEVEDEEFDESEEPKAVVTLNELYEDQQNCNFGYYAQQLMRMFSRKLHFTLQEWFSALEGSAVPTAVVNQDFIPFVVLLNRAEKRDGVRVVDIEEITLKHPAKLNKLDKFILDCPKKVKQFSIVPLKDDIDFGYGIKITNLEFRGVASDSK